MKKMLRTGAVLALAIAGLAGQAGAGLAVSPLKREITVAPGKEVEFFVTVTYNVRGGEAPAATGRHVVGRYQDRAECSHPLPKARLHRPIGGEVDHRLRPGFFDET